MTALPARWRAGGRPRGCPVSAYVSAAGTKVGTGQPGGGTGSGVSANLPPGVSLRQIDGGPDYYCSNGFTFACNAGWDKPSFFPIMQDYAFSSYGSVATFRDLGLNTTNRVTGSTDMSKLRNAGIWAVQAADSSTNTGSETVGTHIEEPTNWSDINDQTSEADSLYGIGHRFLMGGFTWSQFYYATESGSACGGDGTMNMQQVMSCTTGMPGGRHLDIPTADIYWFAVSTQKNPLSYWLIYDQSSATADQLARGSNYGDMVDTMRSWETFPAPTAPYIETDDALAGNGARRILPGEYNWAVWDTIVHGARFLNLFGATNDDGIGSTDGFDSAVQSGQTISNYDQAKATNALVENLARILNSPFALGFASDDAGGYVFPNPHRVWDNGLDIMAKYYTGGTFANSSGTFRNGFYIFASPRGSESQTNINATFTVAGDFSGTIPMVCACSPTRSTGTVSVSNHQFTDTFAKATDVHIYGPIPNQ